MLSLLISFALACYATQVSAFPVARSLHTVRWGVDVLDPKPNTTLAPYPTYRALTDFDYASINLGLYQEWIELDLFNYGLKKFSHEEFDEAGINAENRNLLQFMANQEIGHASLLQNILGEGAATQCTYNYSGAFHNVRSFIDFNVRLTRWGESGVLGFLSKLNSRDSAQLLEQSIHTEARQQMVFRQFAGAFPMPVFFEAGVPQSWQWTLLSRYIQSCPPSTPRVAWSVYPALRIANGPSLSSDDSTAAISINGTALVKAGDELKLSWEQPGLGVGPDHSYITTRPATGSARFAVFVSQLNATYAPLENIKGNSATVTVPAGFVLPTLEGLDPIINGTMFVAITDSDLFVTPFNLTMINAVLVAGPAILQSG